MRTQLNCCLLFGALLAAPAVAQTLERAASAWPARGDSPLKRVTGPVQGLQAVAGAPATMEMKLVPMASYPGGSYNTGGCYSQGQISGNTLTIEAGSSCRTYWNLFLRNWDPDADGDPGLRAWQARVDAASLDNGVGGVVVGADQSCTTTANCDAAFGELCDPRYQISNLRFQNSRLWSRV